MRSYVRSSSPRGFRSLAALLLVEAVALPTLQRLGSLPYLATPGLRWAAWRPWLQATAPQDAVAAALRLMATVGAWWLLVTTLGYLAARALRIPRLLATVTWVTPASVRRLVDGALALSLAAVLSGGGVAAAATGPTPTPSPAPSSATAPAIPRNLPLPHPVPLPAPAPQQPPPARGAAPPGAGTDWRVVPGDNLWSIAAGHLDQALGHPPDLERLRSYWSGVVADNRPHLRSGRPDLIFPGENVSLPPLT